ncbi:Protein TPX2 [Capsicum annuum]|uniref:Protein TPX2 n=1 Tax=Capsicum annuum TaxID=4072 RepID=A0A2G2XZD3_CAPAN|nr:Protein TPX2 [Capsicum annuum]
MADLNSLVMDDDYEFSAPKFYDFINGETEEEKRKAELWFENEINYAPSHMNRNLLLATKDESGERVQQQHNSGRTIQLESLCDFTKDEELQDNARHVRPNGKEEPVVVVTSSGSKEEVRPNGNEESATVLKSSGSTEEVRPNRNEERAAVLTSSGIKETVRPSGMFALTAEVHKQDRKMYAREPVPPFVSIAEMMKKFQSSTREMSLPPMSNSTSQDDPAGKMQRKHKLILTRPKEPEFVTAQRVRPTRVKSSAELEEEMMAKIPKFKARPRNKKILEVPTLPALPKSTPQLPEFKEFHLQTMARANQNAETSTVASIESTQSHQWKSLHLTAPTSPVLKTSLRGRPPRIRSSKEMEKEELEKVPKFKARPLNKKLPLNSESQNNKTIPRNTTPNPFRLSTEERGAEKERKLFTKLLHKQIEEEKSRIRKANPYPYTTDYPVIPPKPEPKKCTKPEPFQLESLVKHEQETWRHMEERRRMEEEEAKMRNFKAQPVLTEDPIPVPEKVRKPLTEVQDFKLRVDNRSLDRAEFDKKIKQKEMMHKRYREETESARMIEEEKALKQLRRTLVPHARPVPKFDHPFLPQKSSKQVTKPRSPKLQIVKRKERKATTACPYAAVSTAASQMR